MTVDQALELLNAAASSALLNKQTHANVQQAYEILKAHLESRKPVVRWRGSVC